MEVKGKLVEIKSCKVKTQGRKYRNDKDQYQQKGRFVISVLSHQKLKKIAESQNKEPVYIFAIYENASPLKILRKKELSWIQADNIFKKGYQYTRKFDGVTFIILDHEKIFRQKRF